MIQLIGSFLPSGFYFTKYYNIFVLQITSMKLNKLAINPSNPFPFKGDEDEWQDFLEKLKRDPEFLEARPIVYDSSDKIKGKFKILAGNKRYKGNIDLGVKELPDNQFFDCKDWDDDKKRRFELADNWHPSGSNWDVDFLTEEEANEWDVFFYTKEDVNLDDFFKDDNTGGGEKLPSFKITLEYTEEDYNEISEKLKEIGKTREQIFYESVLSFS